MDKTEEITQKVIGVWKEHTKDAKPEYIPLFYPPLKDHALLFVGLNPSFGTHWSYLKGTEHDDVWQNPRNFFAWDNGRGVEAKIEKSQDIERLARCEYSFYAPYERIKDCVGYEKWEHVDLFFYRVSKQPDLEGKVFGTETHKILNTFGRKQLELSRQLILRLEPKAVVVVNRLAARIFNYAFEVTFDEKRSYCVTQEGLPVFFTSSPRYKTSEKIHREQEQLIRDLKRHLPSQSFFVA